MTRVSLALCVLAVAACSVSAVVGTRFLASGTFTVAAGGSLTVTSLESSTIAGAAVQISPSALVADTDIGAGLGVSLATDDLLAAGPSVSFTPVDERDITLAQPAAITLPASVPSGQDPDDLVVLAVGPNGAAAFGGPQLTFDPGASRVHFTAPFLGTFQAAMPKRCSSPDDCPQGSVCAHGQCRPGGDDGGSGGPR